MILTIHNESVTGGLVILDADSSRVALKTAAVHYIVYNVVYAETKSGPKLIYRTGEQR